VEVATLARALGLSEHADQATCLAAARFLHNRATTRRKVKSTNEVQTLGFAEEIGPDKFLLEGNEFSGAQLKAVMEARGEADHATWEMDREVPILGEDIHEAAVALLASRQVFKPTAEQLMGAYEEVGAP
jgi:hypothetical protein